eukprot:CAMPEP_0197318530 /NCGR_PEP_ID=MMETSP0891-20130614/51426_1 /TAXON_ID=44058 ORGANISM="Aureoumbra lagunensis, Strain CCMP1510" /NCGR_SAMPLE_ID=MMETSP0891 /ASSEMBLY_ACC=CAM_ASM_000534 /LENGTH=362 /DNA_ID=CAMNT_0042809037 /DNA_START=135 /DNA_END=1226 /DNA_ORIENTATION=-
MSENRESDRRSAVQALILSVLSLSSTKTLATTGDQLDRVVSASELLNFAKSIDKKRRIVITGANSGVGLEGAKLLGSAGHKVVCACRTIEKANFAAEACNGEAAVCDLADLTSVEKFASRLIEQGDLDALVLNAGLALNAGDTIPKRTKDGFELTIGTNHLGHFALYRRLEQGLLLKTPRSHFRLVLTASPVHDPTSGGGKVGPAATVGDLRGLEDKNFLMVDGADVFNADKAYKDSKLCNLLFMAEAARRLQAKNAGTANAFSPGLIPSPNGFFRYQPPLFANVFNAIANVVGVAETPQFGGSCLAFMATDPSLDGLTGAWFDTEPPGKHQLLCHLPSDEARDISKQKKLWALSDRLVGLS